MPPKLKQKDLIKDAFGKMVDKKVRDYILDGHVNLGGEMKDATVLFTDIRGFTNISEKLKPNKVVRLLNRYFEKMGNCIMEENGLVNKYIGDSILAVFGVPVGTHNHPEDSINAALKLQIANILLNYEFDMEGQQNICSGIGIHSGEVLAGNIGSTSRMEYTVIGDTVNIAYRLQGLTKDYKTDLIVSEATVKQVSSEYSFIYLDEVKLKGREKPIKIYTIEDFVMC